MVGATVWIEKGYCNYPSDFMDGLHVDYAYRSLVTVGCCRTCYLSVHWCGVNTVGIIHLGNIRGTVVILQLSLLRDTEGLL